MHELQQPLRQVRVLEAVDGEAAARLGAAVLQVGDDRVVHVLLLHAQEFRTDGVEGVGRELVVAEHVPARVAIVVRAIVPW